MKRMFWLGVGLAAGAYAARRAQSAAESLTPAGIGANLADGLRELGAGIGVTIGRHRGIRAHHSSAGALYAQGRLQLEVNREDKEGREGRERREGREK